MNDKYRILFFKYLFKILKLDTIEDYFIKEKIQYIKSEMAMCDEEVLCHKYSKYFYLLNDINTNFLSKRDTDFLNDVDISDNIGIIIEDFLLRTYKIVMFSKSEDIYIYYGPHSDRFLAKDNLIVLGFKWNEFGFGEQKLLEFEETERQNAIIDKILNEIEKKSDLQIKFIKYNELYERLMNDNVN